MNEPTEASDVTFLLVEDHEFYRHGMRRLLETRAGWRVAAESDSESNAVRLAEEFRPQVAILDLRLKEGDGQELIRSLRRVDPGMKILVSSGSDENLFADRCLQAGACGYIEKGVPMQRLLAAIERIVAGGVYVSDGMANQLLARPRARGSSTNPLDTLTPREREVYAMIGRGLSVKQIAGGLGVSAKTVEYFRQQIKKKLQLPSSAALNRHSMIHPLEAAAAVTPLSDPVLPSDSPSVA